MHLDSEYNFRMIETKFLNESTSELRLVFSAKVLEFNIFPILLRFRKLSDLSIFEELVELALLQSNNLMSYVGLFFAMVLSSTCMYQTVNFEMSLKRYRLMIQDSRQN